MYFVQARRRALGNIQFIGHLYKQKMLTEKIMHNCIVTLLGEVRHLGFFLHARWIISDAVKSIGVVPLLYQRMQNSIFWQRPSFIIAVDSNRRVEGHHQTCHVAC